MNVFGCKYSSGWLWLLSWLDVANYEHFVVLLWLCVVVSGWM